MKKIGAHILSKIVTFCKSYIELCIGLAVFAIGIRFFETILLSRVNHDFFSSLLFNSLGLCYDISLYLRISAWIIPLFIIICFFNEKTATIILRIFHSLMLLFSLICVLFFVTSGFLLDKVIFSYSVKEIIGIIQASTKSPLWVYVVVIILPMLYFYVSGKRIRIRIRIKINHIILAIFVISMLLSFFIFTHIPLDANQYHVKANKAHFFWKSVFKKHIPVFKEDDENFINAIQEFRSYFPEHQFAEPEFPFLYKTICKDVLSPFFNLKPEPPNLVFIIVEGLSAEFVNTDYQLMPFLDSLSQKSLTWEYCLSVSARTFGVLPALFGASPLGEKGFMDMCPNNPEYHSLPRILNQNKYTNYFFYGGWVGFDNMHHFAKENNMTYLKEKEWEEDIIKEQEETFWGYYDHLTYKQALIKLNQVKSSPRMDLYLSLTTHDPFEYPNKSHFQNMVKNKVNNSNTLTEKDKKGILNAINLYGCLAYSDWAIQQLMEGYAKRDDFAHTIFIITGDHASYTSQFGGYNNYHVPLIIYSPMLHAARKMKGVVSHRDITPTILSLLQHNYNINTPDEVTWLNTALDTSLTFNANSFAPMQIIDHSLGGILYKNYLFCEGVLEELTDGTPRKIEDLEIYKQMIRLQSLYQSMDRYVLHNDALIRNFYAHKNKSAKTIINIEDTITTKSYFATKSKLQVIEGPHEHNTTLYFDHSYLYPINFLEFEVTNDIKQFNVEIEFQIYITNENDAQKNLNVVMDLSDISYKSDGLSFSKQNQWFTYKNSLIYKQEMWAQSDTPPLLKIYLWNNDRLEGYIDDIKVKVTTN